jgi:uncharacterized protein YjbJ (UPF0337 family)
MVNQQILQGRWNEIRGKLRSHWGQLTDDDLTNLQGGVDRLIGTIQRKTGEGRDAVEKYLDEVSSEGMSTLSEAAENVRQFSQQAAESVQNTARQAADQLRTGYNEAERFVRERPRESLAICFGAGVLTGVLVSLLIGGSK